MAGRLVVQLEEPVKPCQKEYDTRAVGDSGCFFELLRGMTLDEIYFTSTTPAVWEKSPSLTAQFDTCDPRLGMLWTQEGPKKDPKPHPDAGCIDCQHRVVGLLFAVNVLLDQHVREGELKRAMT